MSTTQDGLSRVSLGPAREIGLRRVAEGRHR